MFKFYQKQNRYRLIKTLFLAVLLICLMLKSVTAQVSDMRQRVQRGVELYNEGNFQEAIGLWHSVLNEYDKTNNAAFAALVSENLARAYQQIGNSNQAIKTFENAIKYYQAAQNLQQVGRMQTELGQVYNNIGQSRKAIALVCRENDEFDKHNSNYKQDEIFKVIFETCSKNKNSAFSIAEKYNDKKGKVAALGTLGEAYRRIGEYETAIKFLELAKTIAPPEYKALLLNSLGNVYANAAAQWKFHAESAKKSRVKYEEFEKKAISYELLARISFEASLQCAESLQDKSSQLRTLLNLIKLELDNIDIDKKIVQALALIPQLPDTSYKAYASVELAMLSQNNFNSTLTQCSAPFKLSAQESLKLLDNAITISSQIKDVRATSFANGSLGHYWECQQDYTKALKYTYEALIAADQNIAAKDSSYLWEWQNGRILDAKDQKSKAIAAYQRAYNTLEAIRSDILNAKSDVQFDFRDVVKPLYSELAKQRLKRAELTSEPKQRKEELSSAIETIDSLKLAELQNFFGNDCITNALSSQKVDDLLDANTAVFSSIILDKHTAIILQFINAKTKQIETKFIWIDNKNLEQKVIYFLKNLKENSRLEFNEKYAENLYDCIIRPFLNYIEQSQIKTLVFIQDGFLRSIPMAALYNRKTNKYLVEDYAIATTPSLRINSTKLRRQVQSALILGLTKKAYVDKQSFDQLWYVCSETREVQSLFPDNTLLMNEDFTLNSFKEALDKTVYPVIHIASHAQFGTIPEDTFIVTGNNQKLTINQLKHILDKIKNQSSPVELIALTACQTAVGDDRATLGLAGTALQVGVKTALASLWKIDDKSTSVLVKDFYVNYRKSNISIAEALQKAQINMIHDEKKKDPKLWAPFIIIGSWL